MFEIIGILTIAMVPLGPNEPTGMADRAGITFTSAEIEQIIDGSGAAARGGTARVVECTGAFGYSTIQSAIDASSDGDVIVVLPNDCEADGKWHENLNLNAKSLRMQSANPNDEEIVAATTILGTTASPTIQSSSQVAGVSIVELDGLTFEGGTHTCYFSKVNLLMERCPATKTGGFFLLAAGQSTNLGQLTVRYCKARQFNQGIFLAASYYDVNVENCSFVDNPGIRPIWTNAGQIRCADLDFINNGFTISSCSFSNATSGLVERCRFYNNRGNQTSVAWVDFSNWPEHSFEFRDCEFIGNRATGHACFYSAYKPTVFRNCTFVGNAGGGTGCIKTGSHGAIITNSIFRENRIYYNGHPSDVSGVNIVADFSSFEAEPMPAGMGNISENPFFYDTGIWNDNGTPSNTQDDTFIPGDYRLLAGSPCIDAGDPTYVPAEGDTDLDGQPRLRGCRVDMGAYEASRGEPGSGDFDGNGAVDLGDMAEFVDALVGEIDHGDCIADLNADGLADGADVQAFVGLLL